MRGKGIQIDGRRTITAACAGKERFESFDLAARIGVKRTRNGKKNHVYKCSACHAFHLGSKLGPTRLKPRQVFDDDEAFA